MNYNVINGFKISIKQNAAACKRVLNVYRQNEAVYEDEMHFYVVFIYKLCEIVGLIRREIYYQYVNNIDNNIDKISILRLIQNCISKLRQIDNSDYKYEFVIDVSFEFGYKLFEMLRETCKLYNVKLLKNDSSFRFFNKKTSIDDVVNHINSCANSEIESDRDAIQIYVNNLFINLINPDIDFGSAKNRNDMWLLLADLSCCGFMPIVSNQVIAAGAWACILNQVNPYKAITFLLSELDINNISFLDNNYNDVILNYECKNTYNHFLLLLTSAEMYFYEGNFKKAGLLLTKLINTFNGNAFNAADCKLLNFEENFKIFGLIIVLAKKGIDIPKYKTLKYVDSNTPISKNFILDNYYKLTVVEFDEYKKTFCISDLANSILHKNKMYGLSFCFEFGNVRMGISKNTYRLYCGLSNNQDVYFDDVEYGKFFEISLLMLTNVNNYKKIKMFRKGLQIEYIYSFLVCMLYRPNYALQCLRNSCHEENKFEQYDLIHLFFRFFGSGFDEVTESICGEDSIREFLMYFILYYFINKFQCNLYHEKIHNLIYLKDVFLIDELSIVHVCSELLVLLNYFHKIDPIFANSFFIKLGIKRKHWDFNCNSFNYNSIIDVFPCLKLCP